jgi:hypothetical protein
MSGVILAVLDHPGAAGTLLAASRRLAELTDARRINALLVRTPPESGMAQSEEILTAPHEASLRAGEANRANAVRSVFDAWRPGTEQAGIAADWIDIDGIAELIVEERGSRADFLVLEQPAQHDYGTSWHALRAALFATDRPVLVVPSGVTGDFGRHIAIAWRGDERATKAVCQACAACRAPRTCSCWLASGMASPYLRRRLSLPSMVWMRNCTRFQSGRARSVRRCWPARMNSARTCW